MNVCMFVIVSDSIFSYFKIHSVFADTFASNLSSEQKTELLFKFNYYFLRLPFKER